MDQPSLEILKEDCERDLTKLIVQAVVDEVNTTVTVVAQLRSDWTNFFIRDKTKGLHEFKTSEQWLMTIEHLISEIQHGSSC